MKTPENMLDSQSIHPFFEEVNTKQLTSIHAIMIPMNSHNLCVLLDQLQMPFLIFFSRDFLPAQRARPQPHLLPHSHRLRQRKVGGETHHKVPDGADSRK